jgi:hypothetical protein
MGYDQIHAGIQIFPYNASLIEKLPQQAFVLRAKRNEGQAIDVWSFLEFVSKADNVGAKNR